MSTRPGIAETPHIRNEQRSTRNGTLFNPEADFWRFSTNGGSKYFDMGRLSVLSTQEFALAVRKTLIWFLENRSVPHAHNMYVRHLNFLEAMQPGAGAPIGCITDTLIVNYQETLDRCNEWYVGSLRVLWRKLTALGYSGISRLAVDLLDESTIKGNQKGWAVLTMDENEGPFTDMELRLIRGAITEAFDQGHISLRRSALTWLYISLGPRSSQVSDLKLKDLEKKVGEDGVVSYVLQVPRVKQRGQTRRGEFRERALVEQVGQILAAWCRQVEIDYGGKVSDYRDLPMFPCNRTAVIADPGFELHPDSKILREEISSIFNNIAIISPRTCELMRVSPSRFRYTIGARAVIYGAGANEVADLLDHSDTQNVLVYTKLSDELIEELNAELSDDLEPLAQAFRGEIVLFDQGFLSDASKLICYPGLDLTNESYTGKCQCGGECGDVPPIFCYSCPHFTAFKGAPHEEALEQMLAERAKELELGNEVVASQMDEAIAACRAVIRKCQESS